MSQIVQRALVRWGIEGAEYQLVAHRENAVFRVDHSAGAFALRLHRKGYRTDAELRSELLWMDAVSKGGIGVPSPIPTPTGDLLLHIDGTQIDVLNWLPGTTLDRSMETRSPRERTDLFHTLGREMARLHEISDAWSRPSGFERVAWNRDGLLGETPLWDRFWENPHLSPDERNLLKDFRHVASNELKHCEAEADYGLIHADLVPANVLVDEQALKLIDFDDGGFGFRVFDVATALLKFMDEEDYSSLRDAMIKGYASVRHLDLSTLDLFMAIRATTYVGWNIKRLTEADALARNKRFINTAFTLTSSYLEKHSA